MMNTTPSIPSIPILITKVLSSNNKWEALVKQIEDCAARPLSSMIEVRNHQPKKIKGNLWEQFCQLWWQAQGVECLTLSELTEEDCKTLRLSNTRDIGIDLILKYKDNTYSAIQCKWRGKGKVAWKELSTFYAACANTGPYRKLYVMTNCNGITYQRGIPKGNITTLAQGTFKKTTLEQWCTMSSTSSTTSAEQVNSIPQQPVDMEQVREMRLRKLRLL